MRIGIGGQIGRRYDDSVTATSANGGDQQGISGLAEGDNDHDAHVFTASQAERNQAERHLGKMNAINQVGVNSTVGREGSGRMVNDGFIVIYVDLFSALLVIPGQRAPYSIIGFTPVVGQKDRRKTSDRRSLFPLSHIDCVGLFMDDFRRIGATGAEQKNDDEPYLESTHGFSSLHIRLIIAKVRCEKEIKPGRENPLVGVIGMERHTPVQADNFSGDLLSGTFTCGIFSSFHSFDTKRLQ